MSAGDHGPESPLELAADLHAGVLSDEAAEAARQRIAADPEAADALAALSRVQADLAALSTADADDPPEDVSRSVTAALRAADGPPGGNVVTGAATDAAHADRPRSPNRLRLLGVVVGLSAAVLAVGVGTVALLRLPAAPTPPRPTANHITVERPAPVIPLSDAEILGLLDSPPEYGPLDDGERRASCLNGLGYPADTPVLGARALQSAGTATVLLVLPAQTPGEIVALLVPATCSTVNTGLIADTVIETP